MQGHWITRQYLIDILIVSYLYLIIESSGSCFGQVRLD